MPFSLAQKLSLRNKDEHDQSGTESSGSFICPLCMAQLPSAHDLQTHFTALHENDTVSSSDEANSSMRIQLHELRTSLQEEKTYSSKLKQQINDLQKKLSENLPASQGDESNYYLQQIQMLEAGKALVTAQMMEMEKQLTELNRNLDDSKRENANLLEKSANYSKHCADLSAKFDEESGRNRALLENLQTLQEKIVDLEAELNARPSEDDVTVLRQELVNAQTLMNDITCAKENELAKLNVLRLELEDRIRDSSNSLDDQAKKHNKELDRLNEEKEELLKQVKELEEVSKRKAALNEQNDKMLIEKNIIIDELNSKLTLLASELTAAKQDLLDGSAKHSQLRASVDKLTAEKMALSKEKDDILLKLQSDESVSAILSQITQEKHDLQQRLNIVEQSLADESEKRSVEVRHLQDQLGSTNQNLRTSNDECDQLKCTMKEQKERLNASEIQLEQLRHDLTEKDDQIKSLNIDNGKLTTEALEVHHAAKTNTGELTMRIETLTSLYDRLTKENFDYTEQANQLRHSLNKCEIELKTASDRLLAKQNECLAREQEFNDEIRNLQNTVAELKAECQNLQIQLQNIVEANKQESNELSTIVTNLERNMAELRGERDELQVAKVEMSAKVEKFMDMLALAEQLDNDQKDKIAVLTFDITSKQNIIEELSEKLQTYENELRNGKAEENQLKKNLEALREQCSLFDKERERLKIEADLKLMMQSNLTERINELELSTQEWTSKFTSLESSNKALQDKFDALVLENDRLKVDIDDKQYAYALLDAKSVELQSNLSDISARYASKEQELSTVSEQKRELERKLRILEEKCERLESDLKKVQDELHNYQSASSQLKRELESECGNFRTKLANAQAEKMDSDAKHAEEIRLLVENVKHLEDAVAKMHSECDRMKIELEVGRKELRISVQAKKDLEAQLSAWNDEKRMLLEKCVSLEKYLEEEKDNESELKRRLDDAISAMYDLGREHQSLQIDINKQFSRKWADDKDAVECLACNKAFSVTVRKHHCRHCGMIFCNECSLKSHLVAASKKPVRVCDNCFQELSSH